MVFSVAQPGVSHPPPPPAGFLGSESAYRARGREPTPHIQTDIQTYKHTQIDMHANIHRTHSTYMKHTCKHTHRNPQKHILKKHKHTPYLHTYMKHTHIRISISTCCLPATVWELTDARQARGNRGVGLGGLARTQVSRPASLEVEQSVQSSINKEEMKKRTKQKSGKQPQVG